LNDLLAKRGGNWVVYGEFSGFKFLPGYQGPRPADDQFIPYDGDLQKLAGPKNSKLFHAFRAGMLLNGVDLPGLAGMTTAAHTVADVDRTVSAVDAALALLESAGLLLQ
jgi:glutamate-1-semialdehyde 2,1-aminomutase